MFITPRARATARGIRAGEKPARRPMPSTPAATFDTGLLSTPVCALECCDVPEYERLILAGGENHLILLDGGDAQLRPLQEHWTLRHEGVLDAVAWGHDKGGRELRIAATGGGAVSMHRLLASRSGECERHSFAMPLGCQSVRDCCFLQEWADRVAVTGDSCSCHVLQFASSSTASSASSLPAAAVLRTLELSSAGVAVRTHPREPQQLMVAEESGHIHFVDLRRKGMRPSLTRRLPPGDADAGGLRDADWSPADPYLVGGVSGTRWVAWDLRMPGLSPAPQAGDAQPSGALAFRWAPSSNHFATAGASGDAWVHSLSTADAAPPTGWQLGAGWQGVGGASPPHTQLAHELPTRLAAVSWLRLQPAVLVGAADTKVCLWDAAALEL